MDTDLKTVVSVRNGRLLAGIKKTNKLHIYSVSGVLEASLTLPSGTLYDVMWTPRGRIVHATTEQENKVVLASISGNVLRVDHEEIMNDIRHLTAATTTTANGSLYVADFDAGLYLSIDDGESWQKTGSTCKLKSGWKCIQLALVSAADTWLWTLEQGENRAYRLSIYKLTSNTDEPLRSDFILPVGVAIQVSSKIILDSDSHSSILLVDPENNALHLLAANGTYIRQLLYASDFQSALCRTEQWCCRRV